MTPRPAIFLDRDGTLNVEVEGTLSRPEQLVLLPGVAPGLARLQAAGFALVVVSNQAAIARGDLDHERLARVHAALATQLGTAGVELDGVFVCPHHESEGQPPYRRACACRKPAPGLLLQAADQFAFDLGRSWIVGDALRDLEAGLAAGVRGVLVRSGKGRREELRLAERGLADTPVVDDLVLAAEHILAADQRRTRKR